MLARAGTADGEMVCPIPCRARKATWIPEGREQIDMGDEGKPQGWKKRALEKGAIYRGGTYGLRVHMFSADPVRI